MCVGSDIGSKYLDLAASEPILSLPRRVPNTAEGIAALIAAVLPVAPRLIVLEAAGSYHQPLLAALLLAELPVAVVNPAQIAALRPTRLGRHTTDRADAQLRVRFAALHHADLRLATPEEPDWARLRALAGSRDDLVAQRTAAGNRQPAARRSAAEAVVAWLPADLDAIAARLREVERAIAALLATRPEPAVLTAQIGVGRLTAAAVVAYLPAGVLGNPKAAAASAGGHPRHQQSGQRARCRLSKQGCPALRRYLYLAAMSAIQRDPQIRAWSRSPCDRGTAPQSAIRAVAHKILRQLMGKLKELRHHQPILLPLAA